MPHLGSWHSSVAIERRLKFPSFESNQNVSYSSVHMEFKPVLGGYLRLLRSEYALKNTVAHGPALHAFLYIFTSNEGVFYKRSAFYPIFQMMRHGHGYMTVLHDSINPVLLLAETLTHANGYSIYLCASYSDYIPYRQTEMTDMNSGSSGVFYCSHPRCQIATMVTRATCTTNTYMVLARLTH
jgi:hypothetical protein